jgi:hypothetical protein
MVQYVYIYKLTTFKDFFFHECDINSKMWAFHGDMNVIEN